MAVNHNRFRRWTDLARYVLGCRVLIPARGAPADIGTCRVTCHPRAPARVLGSAQASLQKARTRWHVACYISPQNPDRSPTALWDRGPETTFLGATTVTERNGSNCFTELAIYKGGRYEGS